MGEQVDRRVDIGVALVLIVIAAVAIWQAAGLPPGTFEPLGSARVPQMTAGLIILQQPQPPVAAKPQIGTVALRTLQALPRVQGEIDDMNSVLGMPGDRGTFEHPQLLPARSRECQQSGRIADADLLPALPRVVGTKQFAATGGPQPPRGGLAGREQPVATGG